LLEFRGTERRCDILEEKNQTWGRKVRLEVARGAVYEGGNGNSTKLIRHVLAMRKKGTFLDVRRKERDRRLGGSSLALEKEE